MDYVLSLFVCTLPQLIGKPKHPVKHLQLQSELRMGTRQASLSLLKKHAERERWTVILSHEALMRVVP